MNRTVYSVGEAIRLREAASDPQEAINRVHEVVKAVGGACIYVQPGGTLKAKVLRAQGCLFSGLSQFRPDGNGYEVAYPEVPEGGGYPIDLVGSEPQPVEREADEATVAQLDAALAVIADLVTGARTIDQAREWLDDHHFSRPVAPTPTEPDWIDHTPGDPMPCEPDMRVQVKFRTGLVCSEPDIAKRWYWKDDNCHSDITAWRPAQ